MSAVAPINRLSVRIAAHDKILDLVRVPWDAHVRSLFLDDLLSKVTVDIHNMVWKELQCDRIMAQELGLTMVKLQRMCG